MRCRAYQLLNILQKCLHHPHLHSTFRVRGRGRAIRVRARGR